MEEKMKFEDKIKRVLNKEYFKDGFKYILVRKYHNYDSIKQVPTSYVYYVLKMPHDHVYKTTRSSKVEVLMKKEAWIDTLRENIDSFKACYFCINDILTK